MAPQPLTFRFRNLQHHVSRWPSQDPQAEVIVALHGFSGSGLDFEVIAESRNRTVACYAPDFIGHGESDAPIELNEYKIDSIIDSLAEMLDHYKINNPIIIGYSMGGRVALQYAIARPGSFRALVLIGATAGIYEDRERERRRRADDELADEIIEFGIEAFADKWECSPVIATQELIPEPNQKAIKRRRRMNRPIGLANSLRGFGTGVMDPVWDKLKSINCRQLLVTGELDLKFAQIAERMEKESSYAHHVSIPQAGHAAHLESPELFTTVLEAFLKDIA